MGSAIIAKGRCKWGQRTTTTTTTTTAWHITPKTLPTAQGVTFFLILFFCIKIIEKNIYIYIFLSCTVRLWIQEHGVILTKGYPHIYDIFLSTIFTTKKEKLALPWHWTLVIRRPTGLMCTKPATRARSLAVLVISYPDPTLSGVKTPTTWTWGPGYKFFTNLVPTSRGRKREDPLKVAEHSFARAMAVFLLMLGSARERMRKTNIQWYAPIQWSFYYFYNCIFV